MRFLSWIAVVLCLAPFAVQAGGNAKKTDVTWAKIVVDFVTPELNKKALEATRMVSADPETAITFNVKKLGGDGKFSVEAIKKKHGAPTKVERFATKEDGKVVTYQTIHYPPLSFMVAVGSDQVTAITVPMKIWTGGGILENAKTALKAK